MPDFILSQSQTTRGMQKLESESNLFQVEQTLAKNAYFSRSPLPGFGDAVIFRLLEQNKRYPDENIYPHFYHWYIVMKQFADSAFDGWIREKRYVDNHSQKSLMLIRQMFSKQGIKALQSSNRKKSRYTSHINQNSQKSLTDSAKIKPIDQKPHTALPQRAQHTMIVQLEDLQNVEEIFNRFYKLKIKLNELKFHNKQQKSIYLKFTTDSSNFEAVKKQIQNWNQVKQIISKQSNPLGQSHDYKKNFRTVSIR